jgi:hypothetical protein
VVRYGHSGVYSYMDTHCVYDTPDACAVTLVAFYNPQMLSETAKMVEERLQ